MAFLNPGYAPWLLAIGIPIAIHLLTRQAAKVVSLPTFRFLQKSVARQSKLFRIRHILLLVLRVLCVALLVAIFLKPTRVAPLSGSGTRARRVVAVIDVSLSMGYRRGGATSLQSALAQAERILTGLGPMDTANVIVAGASPALIQGRLTGDIAALRAAVRGLTPTQEKCDVPAAVAMAAEQLGRAGAGRREIYLVSDFQRTNWANVKLDAVPPDVKVVFVSTEEGARDNVAVTGIRLRPSTPRAGDEATAEAEIWNGTGSPRAIPVRIQKGSEATVSQTVNVPPWSSGTASFPIAFASAGRYVLRASVNEASADGLAADNARWYVADLQHSLTVDLLTDENSAASPNGSYFVSHALNPTPGDPGGIRVVPKRAAELTDADLHSADALILCNVTTMPADRMPRILKYVQAGGSLVVFLYGDHVRAQMEALNRLAGSGEGLPFLPTAPMDVREHGKGYVTLSEARYESPLLRLFKDPSAADLGRIRFNRFFLTTEVDGRAETLLKFEDGTPAAARRAIGAGNVLLLNFSPSPRDGDLVKQEVFPPLLHEMLKGLATRDGGRREFAPGGPASATVSPTRERITAAGPDGARVPVTVDPIGGGVVLENVKKAGIYSLTKGGGREASLIAVNTDPDESDLRTIDPRELQARQERRPTYLAGAGGAARDLDDLSRNRPLWPYLIAALLALLILEQLVSTLGTRGGERP